MIQFNQYRSEEARKSEKKSAVYATLPAAVLRLLARVGTEKDNPQTADCIIEEQQMQFQVNLSDYDVRIGAGKMRLAVKDPTASRDAASKADRLREIFAQFPEVEENLIRAYQSDDGLRAVSFTLAPLRYADGHYVRMLVGEEEPSADAAGKFLLYTTVGGGTEPAPGGCRYTASTYAAWSADALGHSGAVNTGDYVFQASPDDFGRMKDDISAEYAGSPADGVSGYDFWRTDGDEGFVLYMVKDQPSKDRQLSRLVLTSTFAAPQSGDTRQIESYYMYTWSEKVLTVDREGQVTLRVPPEVSDDTWQVYQTVSFDF